MAHMVVKRKLLLSQRHGFHRQGFSEKSIRKSLFFFTIQDDYDMFTDKRTNNVYNEEQILFVCLQNHYFRKKLLIR